MRMGSRTAEAITSKRRARAMAQTKPWAIHWLARAMRAEPGSSPPHLGWAAPRLSAGCVTVWEDQMHGQHRRGNGDAHLTRSAHEAGAAGALRRFPAAVR